MSTENISKDVIGDLIEPPIVFFLNGSNHEMSPSSSQSSLTKHLDTTNNYNSESFQQLNNNEQSSKLKASLKSNENINHCFHNNAFTNGEASSNKNVCSHNISIDIISSEEDANHEFEINQNLDEINCDDKQNLQTVEKRNWRNSESNTKINKSNYEIDEKEIVYDQINEIIAKIATGKTF